VESGNSREVGSQPAVRVCNKLTPGIGYFCGTLGGKKALRGGSRGSELGSNGELATANFAEF
jgi:hypothetical protein